MNAYDASARHPNQRGVATLFITLMLLLVAGLVILYTNRGAVMEQRLSANEIRTKQAFAAANAGLDQAIAYMQNGGIDHTTPPNGADTFAVTTQYKQDKDGNVTTEIQSYFTVIYCSANPGDPGYNPPQPCPPTQQALIYGPPSNPNASCSAPVTNTHYTVALACGWSDDNSAVQRITQVLQGTPSLAGSVATPLISQGFTNVATGGANVFNYFNDMTVWAGSGVGNQSAPVKTYIRDTITYPQPDTSADYRLENFNSNSPGGNNTPPGYQPATTAGNQPFVDIVSDDSLTHLSTDQFFALFFGSSMEFYKANIAGDGAVITAAQINTVNGASGKIIWVDGNVSLGNITLGTQSEPVIFIVNGSLSLGNTTINGVVFAKDGASGGGSGGGSPTIYGTLISAGNADLGGNAKIIYDPVVIAGTTNLGIASKLQGSWKDW